MLPALNFARERARSNLGIDNQRQCAIYLNMAEKDLNGFLINGSMDFSWCGVLSKGKISNNLPSDFVGLGYFEARKTKIIKCPKINNGSNLYQHRGFGMPAGDYNKGKLVFADEYDNDLQIPDSFEELKKTEHLKLFRSKMTSISKTVLLTDDFRVEYNGTLSGGNTNALKVPQFSGYGGGTGFVTFPHSNKANVLFGDLHSETLTPSSYKKIYYKKNNICGSNKLGIKIKTGLLFENYFDLKTQSVKYFGNNQNILAKKLR